MKMLFYKAYITLMVLSTICSLSYHAEGQSRWTHGVGIGVAITDFVIEADISIDREKYAFDQLANRSFYIWNKYNLTEKLQFTTSPGFSWRGARFVREGFNYNGIYLVTPTLLEYNVYGPMSLGAGIEYSHVISLGESSDDEVYNLTSQVTTRHLFSCIANVRYMLGQHTSLNIAYNHGLNSFYKLSRFNTAGGTVDHINLRNKGLQITFIFHT